MRAIHIRAIFVLFVLAAAMGTAFNHLAAQWTFQAIAALTAIAVIVGLKVNKPNKRDAWYGLIAACVFFFLSYGLRLCFPTLNSVPGGDATIVDVTDTLGYLSALISTLRLGQVRDRDKDPTTIIDAVIVTGGISAIIWIAVMLPYVQNGELSTFTKVVAVYSAALTVGLIFAAVRLGLGPSVKNWTSRLLAFGALSAMLSQISVSAGYGNTGNPTLFFGSLALLSVAAAALHPAMVVMTEPVSRGVGRITTSRMVVMGVALLIAPSMLAVRASSEGSDLAFYSGLIASWILVTGLVMVRFAGLVIARERVAAIEKTRSETVALFVTSPDIKTTNEVVLQAVYSLAGKSKDLRVSIALKDEDWTVRASFGLESGAALGRVLDSALMTAMTASGDPYQLEETITFDAPLNGKSAFLVVPLVSKNEVRGALMVASLKKLDGPQVAAIESISTDVALALEAMRLTESLHRQRSEQRFKALVEHSADITLVFSGQSVDFASPAAERLFGSSFNTRDSFLELVHHDDVQKIQALLRQASRDSQSRLPCEFRMFVSGAERWLEATASDLSSMSEVNGIVFNAREITERKAVEAERDLRDARFRSLVQNSSDLTIVLDRRATFTYISPSVTTLLQYEEDYLEGTEFKYLVHPSDQDVLNTLAALLLSGSSSSRHLELRVRSARNEWKTLDVTLTNLLDDPSVQGVVMNAHDVTDRKQLEQDLRERVLHDDLTGLANRVLFRERVEHALRSRGGGEHVAAVMYLDIDDFKDVNDGFGHDMGDDLLRTIAFRLQQFVRAGDTAARLGADEFAILLEEVYTVEDLTNAAERLLEVVREPVDFEGRELDVRASIGVALAARTDTADIVLRNADVALYHAKQTGKGRAKLFDQAMHETAFERLELRVDLQRALERDELSLHYQPLTSFATGAVVGFEALMRWTHPVRGFVSPAVFIPLAEESGLIVPLGQWALKTALDQLKIWQQRGNAELGMSVNVSPRQLEESDVVSCISSILTEVAVDPRTVTLELTESSGLDDTQAGERLTALRELGCEIAADDFGTGFASYAALQKLPFTNVKIDRSLIIGVAFDDRARAQVDSIIQMGHALNLSITAEGIEEVAQMETLKELGADKAQGYLLGRPISADEVEKTVLSKSLL